MPVYFTSPFAGYGYGAAYTYAPAFGAGFGWSIGGMGGVFNSFVTNGPCGIGFSWSSGSGPTWPALFRSVPLMYSGPAGWAASGTGSAIDYALAGAYHRGQAEAARASGQAGGAKNDEPPRASWSSKHTDTTDDQAEIDAAKKRDAEKPKSTDGTKPKAYKRKATDGGGSKEPPKPVDTDDDE